MHLLVTGRSGCGKTTVCNTLQKLGKPAFDADRVEGLVGWVDLKTNVPVEVDYSQPINKNKVGWFWAETILQDILSTRQDLILCGSADNQLQYYHSFDRIIILDISAQEQTRRINIRTSMIMARLLA